MVATVLYTDDMEPITVFDIPVHLMDRPYILVPVPVEMKALWVEEDQPIDPRDCGIRTIELRRETFHRNGRLHQFWFVNERDLIDALKLRPDFLAGQRDEVDRRVRGALMQGFLMGMSE